jgi:hypothetical protein
MDIWGGDPWTEPEKSEDTARKGLQEVKGPSGFLAGFEDEAGWGDFGDGGGWDNEARIREGEEGDSARTSSAPAPVSPGWDSVESTVASVEKPVQPQERSDFTTREPLESSERRSSSLERQDSTTHIIQKSSDSDCTDVPDLETLANPQYEAKVAPELQESPRPSMSDDGKGVQPSLTSSESSNGEESRTPDSLRTSIDESYHDSEQTKKEQRSLETQQPLPQSEKDDYDQEDDFGDFEAELQDLDATSDAQTPSSTPNVQSGSQTAHPTFKYDLSLVTEMFEKPATSRNAPDSSAETINNSSSRKSWYRITRPQTMREFNEGSAEDSYVRIAWPRSKVRSETLKIVSRWASEDRIHGRVTIGGRLPEVSSFGWDDTTSAPPQLQRRKSGGKKMGATKARVAVDSKPVKSTTKGAENHQPSTPIVDSTVASSPVAQFSWSSSPQTTEPNKAELADTGDQLDALFGYAVPQPSSIKAVDATLSAPRRGSRSASVSFTPANRPVESSHRRSATAVHPGLDIKAPGFMPQLPLAIPESPSTKLVTIAPEGIKEDYKEKSSLNRPAPLEIDTTERTLHPEPEEADNDFGDWGELIKPPSPLPIPVLFASKMPSSGSIESSKSVSPPPNSRKAKKPSPLVSSAPPSAIIPSGPLSPARKAAFEAARVTRSLSSQQRSDSLLDDETSQTDSTPRKEPIFLPTDLKECPPAAAGDIPEPTVVKEEVAAARPSPHEAILPFDEITQSPKLNPLLEADFSVFDAPTPLAPNLSTSKVSFDHPPTTPAAEQPPRTMISPTNENNEIALRIIRGLPDLSYMLR